MQDETTEEHPSFGMIQISRVQSTPSVPLFGSSILHHELIALRIEHATVSRHLNRHWYHGKDQIVEVYMSYSQFMRAIMSMNTSGIPCTLNRMLGKSIEQKSDVEDTKELFRKEIQTNLDKTFSATKEACKFASELIDSKTPLNKEQKKTLKSLLFKINQDLESNISFIGKSFDEQMDKTVTEAHGEIEAFFDAKITSLGIEALQKQILGSPISNEIELKNEGDEYP